MMSVFKSLEKGTIKVLNRYYPLTVCNYSQASDENLIQDTEEFRVLNIKQVRSGPTRRKFTRTEVMPPRTNQMSVDQDWGSVWPAPRSFHPASVPLPLRQGYVPKGQAPPGKFANAELMKIPNFLHLTPPVVKKQCEALKKFCTPWPEGLETFEQQEHHFPLEVITSDYCHSSPTIRNELARIVTIKFKLSKLQLDDHGKDKFLRLVGERFDPATDVVTIVTDRCPTRKQNYDYGQYLLTALFHESKISEPWEADKTEDDMELYVWANSVSRKSVLAIHSWGKPQNVEESTIKNLLSYSSSVSHLINEGEDNKTVNAYKEAVKHMFDVPNLG